MATPRPRKTVDVARVKEWANTALAAPGCDPNGGQGERRGIALMLERVLFDTDNYKGFRYLPSEWDEATLGWAAELRDNYDDTRREYL